MSYRQYNLTEFNSLCFIKYMKVIFDSASIYNGITFLSNQNRVSYLSGENNLSMRRIETDRFGRDIDAKQFDSYGKLVSHQHKYYHGDDLIEKYRDSNQEYTRKIYYKVKNGFKHRIEEFISKTSPDKNYVHESVRDASDKLVKFIQNGKVVVF